jgi:site-specific recombinase XerD
MRDKIRFVPVHPMVLRLIGEYLEAGKHGGELSHENLDSPLCRPAANNRTGTLERHFDPGSIYRNIVMKYAKATGVSGEAVGSCVHSMRATAATNALSNEADIAKVQEWLGHANVSTTRITTGVRPGRRIALIPRKILIMSNRDDFTQKTKRNVAMRASWHSSLTGCGKSTQ